MNLFIVKNTNTSVVQSVSALVAEGGNVLATDDGPSVSRQTFLEATMLENTRRAASQLRVRQSSLLTPHRILLRASSQRRPTLHLPSRRAMTEESESGEQPRRCKVSYRPRSRMTLGQRRPANGSS